MSNQMIPDKQSRPIGIHDLPNGWKITPFQRDCVYQVFLRAFPNTATRYGILKERLNEEVRDRTLAHFDNHAQYLPISASRIYAFVSEAVATEAGELPKSQRWDWWVGCSLKS